MATRQRPKRSGKDKFTHSGSGEGRQARVGDYGLSVYREVRDQPSFDRVLKVFDQATTNLGRRLRGESLDHKPALYLLEISEVKRNRSLIGHIALREAIDDIYESVPSLRRPLALGVGGVCMVGTCKDPLRTIGLSFDEATNTAVREERAGILNVLEEYGLGDGAEYRWIQQQTPHIALGRVSTDAPPSMFRDIVGKVGSVAPPTLGLERAVIHNPTGAPSSDF